MGRRTAALGSMGWGPSEQAVTQALGKGRCVETWSWDKVQEGFLKEVSPEQGREHVKIQTEKRTGRTEQKIPTFVVHPSQGCIM